MIATNNLNCTIKKKLLILLTLFSLNSCEELEESLADNSVSTGDSCHVSWVGKYKGPNDLTDHFEGKTCTLTYDFSISYDSNRNSLRFTTLDYARSCTAQTGLASLSGWGACASSSVGLVEDGSHYQEISLTKSGNTIRGTGKVYKKDGSGNKTLFMSHNFTVTKQ